MKNIFIVLLAGFTLLLSYILLFPLRSKNSGLVLKIKTLMYSSIEILLANIFIATAQTKLAATIAYSLYFAGLDWILLFTLSFCYEYTTTRRKARKIKKVLNVIVAIDTLSFIYNIFYNHIFTVFYFGNIWKTNTAPIYSIHLALDYFLVLMCFFYLIRAFIFAPSIYKIKYVAVLAAIVMIVVVNAFYMITHVSHDASVLLYPIFAIGIYYIAQISIPSHLMTLTMKAVADDLKNALVMIDIYGSCVYMNDSAREIFSAEKDTKSEILELLDESTDFFDKPNSVSTFKREKDGKTRHYRLDFNRLETKKGRFIGSYFIIIDVTDELEKLEQEHFRATHDLLTGLYSKEHFYDMVSERLQTDRENDYLMLCSNVVNFKLINDQYGTKRGDEVLKRIAAEMQRLASGSDILGRLNADRFALLMPKKNFEEEIFLIESLKSLNLLDDAGYSVICQIGVYAIDERNILVSVMCDRAFLALETIKKDVSKQIAYYDDELRRAVLREQEITNAIPHAIKNNEIQVFLQPQFDRYGNVLGAEALARWFSKDRGRIPTKEFIKTLEDNGMITVVDQYVWDIACRELAKWKKSGNEDLYISINISPKDLYLLDICKTLSALVEKYGIQPKNLKLEITEAAVMLDAGRQSELIDRLRNAGFSVEMDDFGRGYSSLNTLKDLTMDELKIDLEFLHDAKDEQKGRKILEKMISMSKEIGLKVVTEGVETQEQADFLQSIGTDIYQGYFFAEPMTLAKFDEKYIQKENILL